MEEVPVELVDKDLYISLDTWHSLLQQEGTSVYESLRAFAQDIIKRGGAFMICNGTEIWRRCDRLSELDEAFSKGM